MNNLSCIVSYNMGSNNHFQIALLLFLCFFIFTLSTTYEEDEAYTMKQLASQLSPTPLGWNNSYHHCYWEGVRCNASSRQVTTINLNNKNLSGSFPSAIYNLSKLTFLNLRYNYLSGSLPSLTNMYNIRSLSLYHNNFTSIPDDAFFGVTSLEILSIGNNPILTSWPFPTQLANCPKLSILGLKNINLRGSIPDIFNSWPSLQFLSLSQNHLSGSLPPSLSRPPIQKLWLSNQSAGLSGPLDILANMPSLILVYLNGNTFTGPIPNLSVCQSLEELHLQNNLLTGLIDTLFISLPNLTFTSLQNNKLQGPFPEHFKGRFMNVTENSLCKDTQPGPCDQQVMTLLQVAKALGYPIQLAKAWKGNNACNNWTYVHCDSSGHVIIVAFSRQGFQGTISPAFANLTSLIELHLNDNNLTGILPDSLKQLPSLKILDLSNNNIFPPFPAYFASRNIIINISGNPHLLGTNIILTRRNTVLKLILLILLGAFVALISVASISIQWFKKRKLKIKQQKEANQLETSLQLLHDYPSRFTYEVMKVATNNFDMKQKLGDGGFGSVFEGTLGDGNKVAVKRLDRFSQGMKEFLAEVRTIGNTHHLNLVKLVGFCAEKTHRLLVYEYMSNGSLDKWIFHNNSARSLNWDVRRRIILQIAKGLAYLHEECIKRIAHLDVKPQNVLLDEGFNAKLSDFGLAKLIERDQSHVMTQMRGTRGYLAPEWLDRKITEKADVYSYGVVMLEVAFERKNLDVTPPEDQSDNRLIYIVRKKVEANQLSDLFDNLSEDMKQNGEEVERTIKLALSCLQTDPGRRPSMSMVVKILEGTTSMALLSAYDDVSSSSMDGSTTQDDTTKVSDCILSGPR